MAAHRGEQSQRRRQSAQSPQLKSRIGAILRATSGNFLEQFDFFLFGFYASAIAKAFFPSTERDRRAAEHLRRCSGSGR